MKQEASESLLRTDGGLCPQSVGSGRSEFLRFSVHHFPLGSEVVLTLNLNRYLVNQVERHCVRIWSGSKLFNYHIQFMAEFKPKEERKSLPLPVIKNIVREYEIHPNHVGGRVVCRYVAELEPKVFEQIAEDTGLTISDLWSYINDEERRGSKPHAAETVEPLSGQEKYEARLKRLTIDDNDSFS